VWQFRNLILFLYIAGVILSRFLLTKSVSFADMWLALGLILGWFLPMVDHLIYCVTYPHELTVTRVNEMVKAKNFWGVWELLRSTAGERNKLVLHGVVVQSVFWVFSLWVVTSSRNGVGVGLVLGALLNLLVWDWSNLTRGSWANIFWQIKRTILLREAKWTFVIFSLIFGYLTFAAFWR